MQASEKQYWLTEIADVYHSPNLAGANEMYHVYLRDILIHQKGGGRALELGCGKGLWTEKLSEKYDELDVVDASPELIKHVSDVNQDKTRFTGHVALIEDFLSKATQKWDHIYMTFMLEHLENPVETLKMILRRLDLGGQLFIAVPNADSVHRVLALRAGMIRQSDDLSENDKLVGHKRVYTRQLLLHQLEEAGFSIDKVIPVGLKPLTLKQLESLPDSVIHSLCQSGDLVKKNAAYLAVIATGN